MTILNEYISLSKGCGKIIGLKSNEQIVIELKGKNIQTKDLWKYVNNFCGKDGLVFSGYEISSAGMVRNDVVLLEGMFRESKVVRK